MPGLVYPTTTCKLQAKSGIGYQLLRGTAWDADDPLVKEHPEHFSAHPVVVFRTVSEKAEATVERATRAPGEKRGYIRRTPPDAKEDW